jgi:hypothetical protein
MFACSESFLNHFVFFWSSTSYLNQSRIIAAFVTRKNLRERDKGKTDLEIERAGIRRQLQVSFYFIWLLLYPLGDDKTKKSYSQIL